MNKQLSKLKTIVATAISTLIISPAVFAHPTELSKYPLYFGVAGGYGSTNWHQLKGTDPLSKFNNPRSVKEGGETWGVFAGYQFTNHFAVEAEYYHLHKAELGFGSLSVICPSLSSGCTVTTHTDAVSLMAKYIIPIFNTGLFTFASVGGTWIHRSDRIAETNSNISPAFGAGIGYPINKHLFIEADFDVLLGHIISETLPVQDYIPFIYAANLKLGYRFKI